MLLQVKKTIQQYRMFDSGEKVVAAVSGGPDSVALLCILKELNIKLCLDIGVAHLDHGLRSDSAKDLVFVRKLAQEMHFPFFSRVLSWKKIGRRGSLEDQLRRLRYDFFFDVCRKIGAKKIALGHTRDDQAETVIMRILRGSGLYGLSAILPVRRQGALEIVRPMIEVSRKEVLDYLGRNNFSFRVDSTNLEDKFLRNKVRNKLLPLLEKEYNPNIKEGLSNLALIVGADYAYLAGVSETLLKKKLICQGRRSCSLALSFLKEMDISLRRVSLRRIIESLCGDLRRLSFRHWQEIEDLIFKRPQGSQVHLPQGIALTKAKNRLHIFKR